MEAPPTEQESYNDPTNTLQYYIHGFIVDGYNPDLSYTHNNFYYAVKTITPELLRDITSLQFRIFELCANQDRRENPVDDAIHAYSKLIRNIIFKFPVDINYKIVNVLKVVEFLKTKRTRDNLESYTKMKNSVLLLFGEDMLVSIREGGVFYSTQIYTEMKTLLLDIFRDEQRYINSSDIVKSVIFRFYILDNDPRFRQAYSEMSPLSKAHFFIHIMNIQKYHTYLTDEMTTEIITQLGEPNSELNRLVHNYSRYPIAHMVAASLKSGSGMPQYIPPTPDTDQRPVQQPHMPALPAVVPQQLVYDGESGGSRRNSAITASKRKKIKQSKRKSKYTRKSNKNKMQRKKSRRRN